MNRKRGRQELKDLFEQEVQLCRCHVFPLHLPRTINSKTLPLPRPCRALAAKALPVLAVPQVISASRNEFAKLIKTFNGCVEKLRTTYSGTRTLVLVNYPCLVCFHCLPVPHTAHRPQ